MKTCWTRQQLQANTRRSRPNLASRAGWARTAGTSQAEGHRSGDQVGTLHHSRPEARPPGNPGSAPDGRAPPVTQLREATTSSRGWQAGLQPRASAGNAAPPPLQASRAAAAGSATVRVCSCGRAGRVAVPPPARLSPWPDLPSAAANLPAPHSSAPKAPWQGRCGGVPAPSCPAYSASALPSPPPWP
jgi:hypothetical protein